jgi:hypothetical protein
MRKDRQNGLHEIKVSAQQKKWSLNGRDNPQMGRKYFLAIYQTTD